MKKILFLTLVTFFTIMAFMASTAKAESSYTTNTSSSNFFTEIWDWFFGGSTSTNSNSNTSDKSVANTGTTTQLPINNGVVFLIIAGMVIGVTTLKRKKLGAATAA